MKFVTSRRSLKLDRGSLSFLSADQLQELGLRTGRGVRVSSDARIFGGERITIADNVRVDAFCVLSAGTSGAIQIGSHIHIASGARLFGEGGIVMEDFSSVSAGSTLYSASDDYSGDWLMGPTVSEGFTLVDARPISLQAFAAVGAHSLVLPGVCLGSGCVLGASSMAASDLDPWTIYAGTPCRPLKARSRNLVALAEEFDLDWRSKLE